MSGLRLAISAVLGAAAIVLGMVSPAVAASAAPNITILSAGPDGNGDPYNLTVTASDTNGTGDSDTSMTAHVFSASMQDVADPTMTYVVRSPGRPGLGREPADRRVGAARRHVHGDGGRC